MAKQVAALHDGDFDTFLCLVNESGRSSWEYLQNVIPAGYKEHQEVGVTIAAAKHLLGDKGAVRVHGGGFAGTVQAFVPVEMLDEFKAGMEAILGEGRCHVLSIRPEGGAVLLSPLPSSSSSTTVWTPASSCLTTRSTSATSCP